MGPHSNTISQRQLPLAKGFGQCRHSCYRQTQVMCCRLVVGSATHTCPHNSLRKIKVTICYYQVQPKLLVAWCMLWWFASKEKGVVILNTKCPNWDNVSLNNTEKRINKNSYGSGVFFFFFFLNHFKAIMECFDISNISIINTNKWGKKSPV